MVWAVRTCREQTLENGSPRPSNRVSGVMDDPPRRRSWCEPLLRGVPHLPPRVAGAAEAGAAARASPEAVPVRLRGHSRRCRSLPKRPNAGTGDLANEAPALRVVAEPTPRGGGRIAPAGARPRRWAEMRGTRPAHSPPSEMLFSNSGSRRAGASHRSRLRNEIKQVHRKAKQISPWFRKRPSLMQPCRCALCGTDARREDDLAASCDSIDCPACGTFYLSSGCSLDLELP